MSRGNHHERAPNGLVRDLRSKAWCWQDKESIRLIRRHWQNSPPEATTLASALGIYLVLSELASNSNSLAEFSAPRRRIAELVGVSERTLLRYIRAFEALGLVRVEERRVPGDESVQLPNAYSLLDPPAATPDRGASTPPHPADAAAMPEGVTPAPPRMPETPSRRATTPRGGRIHALRSGSVDAIDQEEYPQEKQQTQEEVGREDRNDGTALWLDVRAQLERELTRSNFATWIADLESAGYTGTVLALSAPNSYVLDWVQTRLRGVIERAASAVAGRRIGIELTVRS